MNEVYEFVATTLGVTWREYADPMCGRIINGSCQFEGASIGCESPVTKSVGEPHDTRFAKERCLLGIVKEINKRKA